MDKVDRRAKDNVTVNAKAGAKSEARARHNKANLHRAVGKVAANLRPAAKVRRSKAVASAISAARAHNEVPGVVPVVVPTKAAIRINLVTQVRVAEIKVAPIRVAAARLSRAAMVHHRSARPRINHPRIDQARTSPTSKTSPTWTTSKPMPVMTSALKCRADNRTVHHSPAPVDKVVPVDPVVAVVVAVVVAAGAAVVRVGTPVVAKAATAVVRPPLDSRRRRGLASCVTAPITNRNTLDRHTPMLAFGLVAEFAAAAPLA